MEGFLVLIPLTAIGCGTAIILTAIDKIFGSKQKKAEEEAKIAQERVRHLEAQLVDAHRQNELLQKQVEWHAKLLETQDRVMKQLTDGHESGSTRTTSAR